MSADGHLSQTVVAEWSSKPTKAPCCLLARRLRQRVKAGGKAAKADLCPEQKPNGGVASGKPELIE
jgi:hypothetical protein